MKMKNFNLFLFIFSFILLSCNPDEMSEVVIDCTNGVQDGDETGVDCGGSCSSCLEDDNTFVNGMFDEVQLDLKNSVNDYEGRSNYVQLGCVIDFKCNLKKYEDGDPLSYVDRIFFIFHNLVPENDCNLPDSWSNLFTPGHAVLVEDGPTDPYVEVIWHASNNHYWDSRFGDQSESTFTISEIKKVSPGINGSPLFLIGHANMVLGKSTGETVNAEFEFGLKMHL